MRNGEPLARAISASSVIVVVVFVWKSIVAADAGTIAAQVAAQFEAEHLDALAAEDPNEPGRFVAAIYVGGHLLTISTVHPSPAFVRQEIAAANHRYVYSILSTSGKTRGRLFVEDFGTPGLTIEHDPMGSFDITWRDAVREVTFDGDWGAQQLSEAEYYRRFANDAVEYEGMLRLLAAALRQRFPA